MPSARLALPLALLMAASLAAPAASAQTLTQRKPGLWEVETSTAGTGMPQVSGMKEMMASMPPEQRARMERAMKDQGVGRGGKPNSFRFCMSKAQAERTDVPVNPDPDTQCSNRVTPLSASEATFTFDCKRKDGSSMTGEGRAHGLTPERYAMDLRMKIQHPGQLSRWTCR